MRRALLIFLIAFLGIQAAASEERTILIVQRKLKTLGLYHGTVDGLLGSKTNAAIRRYQVKKHLTITGELNEQTLRSLKITVPAKK